MKIHNFQYSNRFFVETRFIASHAAPKTFNRQFQVFCVLLDAINRVSRLGF
jgi:hypothetical protein